MQRFSDMHPFLPQSNIFLMLCVEKISLSYWVEMVLCHGIKAYETLKPSFRKILQWRTVLIQQVSTKILPFQT
jgi:hypothetical protein